MFGSFNSLPFLIVSLCFILMICRNTKQRNMGKNTSQEDIFMAFVVYFIFIGLRNGVGYDWSAYVTFFDDCYTNYGDFVFRQENSNSEILFQYYLFCLKNLWNNVNFFFAVSTAIDLVVICWLFKKYSAFFMLSMLIYYTLFLDSVSVMRNMKSLSIFYLSIPFLIQRKAIPYFILNLIAFGFHASSIVFLPLYFFITRQFSKYAYIVLFVICHIVFLLKLNIFTNLLIAIGALLGGRISYVINGILFNTNFNDYSFLSVGYLERFCTGALMLFYYDRLTKKGRSIVTFYNLFFMFYIARFLFAEFDVLPMRGGLLFLISYCILLPQVYTFLKPRGKAILLLIIFAFSLMRVYSLTSGEEAYIYSNILFD